MNFTLRILVLTPALYDVLVKTPGRYLFHSLHKLLALQATSIFYTPIRLQLGNSKSRSASDLVELCIFNLVCRVFRVSKQKLKFLRNDFPLSLISLNSKICSNVMRKRCSNTNKEEAELPAVRERDSQIGFCVQARP